MMATWGKVEADLAERATYNRLCWYNYGDGSGGFAVSEVPNDEEALFLYEIVGSMAEFMDFEIKPVIDLESAMPLAAAVMERTAAVSHQSTNI